ncbi:unnamed protein product [Chrysoparadoxa australica]
MWTFERYESSEWEQSWRENVVRWSKSTESLCGEMKRTKDLVDTWIEGVAESHAEGCGGQTAALGRGRNTQVFSTYTHKNSCTGEVSTTYIEPLAGLTRHPMAMCYSSKLKVDKNFLVFGQAAEECLGTCSHNRHPYCHSLMLRQMHQSRVHLLDMGASLYTSGSGGASQSWFVETLSHHGAAVDEFYGWEAKAHPPADVWSQVPDFLKPHYHWFNIPVNPAEDSPDNPWNLLRAIATPSGQFCGD